MQFPVFSLVLLGSACAECEPWALWAAQLGQGGDDQPLSQAQTAQLMTQQMLLVHQQP